MGTRTAAAAIVIAAGILGSTATVCGAQSGKVIQRRVDPRAETLGKMSRLITAEFDEQPLREVFEYIEAVTEARIVVEYIDDMHDSGFDPDMPISMKITEQPALSVVGRINRLVNTSVDSFSDATWQLSEAGEFEIGPKDRLGRHTRTVIYDVRDLLFTVPHFTDAPAIDVGQSSGGGGRGGGGGQSPFRGGGGGGASDRGDLKERTEALVDLIQLNIEPEEWLAEGGASSTISAYQNESLIITAPDFVHRQIGGYSFWPGKLHRMRVGKGRFGYDILPKPLKLRP